MNKNQELIHSGTPQPFINQPIGSGHYRRGTGENPFQRQGLSQYQKQINFRDTVLALRKEGLTDKEIMAKLSTPDHEIKSPEFRALMTIGKTAKRDYLRRRALELHDRGVSNVEIAKKIGVPNESSVRGLLDPVLAERNSKVENTAKRLEKAVAEKKMIDVGKGTGLEIGVSNEQLRAAVNILKEKGYNVYDIHVPQATDPFGGKSTSMKILTDGETTLKDVWINKDKVGSVTDYTPDKGKRWGEVEYPASVDGKRVMIRYAEDGGKKKDGVIELRPGVEDLDLKGKHYAQVRIAVDDSHFLKGMAIYSDPKNFPDGVDIIFNTNKHVGTDKMKVLKEFKKDTRTGEIDKENPFGSLLKAGGQSTYIGKDGKEHLSAINIVKEEGDWAEQSKTIASQMLSKQSLPLIKKQLGLSYAEFTSEYEELKTLTNPSVKKKLLESFGDKCDKAAAELKACSFPRQQSQVILPVDSLNDNEIFAPNFRDGETVALVRYPHAGPFELPVLKVNNKNREAKKYIGLNSQDAVGINTNVAEILSGADFDGDSVTVIPVNSRIKLINSSNSNAIKVANYLKNFDPKESYPEVKGMKYLEGESKQMEMGKVSNLISDMTLKQAKPEEIARAVKHSMVVIDAEKHYLNYQASYLENGIKQLKIKYQGVNSKGQPGGASTLISLAKQETRVPRRTGRTSIDPETGERIFYESSKQSRIDKKTGKEIKFTSKVDKMSTVKDAFELSSGHPKETEYAKYANSLKSLANQARKESLKIERLEKNPSAAKIYSAEIASLDSKLNQSLKNAPKERMAQRIANKEIDDRIWAYKSNPNVKDLTKEEMRKIRQTAISNARAQVGAGRSKITDITDREWEAIQSGAMSKTKLDRLISSIDEETLKKRALPKSSRTLPQSKINSIKAKMASGLWSAADVAESMGISVSTVHKYANAS